MVFVWELDMYKDEFVVWIFEMLEGKIMWLMLNVGGVFF